VAGLLATPDRLTEAPVRHAAPPSKIFWRGSLLAEICRQSFIGVSLVAWVKLK
jgi:hypothetical protein